MKTTDELHSAIRASETPALLAGAEFARPELSSTLSRLLEERGWRVYRLAQEAGVPQSTLANLFLRNNMPTVPTLERICQALGITMAEFFSQQPTLPPEEELTAQLLEEWAALSPAQKRLVLELVHQLGRP